ncbi:MAG: M20 family metallopeptidase [Bryobacteraceae bacterium]|nr:M20 family metallopeptidase [Bryobacteraceae bacterium]
MDPILAHVQAQQPQLVQFLRQLVECESPSDDAAAVNRCADLFADSVGDIAKVSSVKGGKYGRHLICDFALPGKRKEGLVLGLGHTDTVYPLGILRTMPWREAEGRYWGPGVLDMKAGVAFFVFAMRALRALDIPVRRKVKLLLVSEEEVGSPVSRPLTEKTATGATAVLVLEPGTGLSGKLKTARKGIGGYRVTVTGHAAHAGVDFTQGASAIVELAHQIERIASFTDLAKGTTVNPGTISGGTRSNVIAAEAMTAVDFRIAKLSHFSSLDRRFRALKATNPRCTVTVTGGLNRPPMERTRAIAALFALARKLALELGVEMQESATGGGSDGNFTAALGVPTLDGLGAVGEGAHAPHESILIDRIADRTALLAKLTAAL